MRYVNQDCKNCIFFESVRDKFIREYIGIDGVFTVTDAIEEWDNLIQREKNTMEMYQKRMDWWYELSPRKQRKASMPYMPHQTNEKLGNCKRHAPAMGTPEVMDYDYCGEFKALGT